MSRCRVAPSRGRGPSWRAPGALTELALLASVLACSTPRTLEYAPDAFRRAVAEKLGVETATVEVPFEVDSDAVEAMRRLLRPVSDPRERASRLADALVSERAFGITYDPLATSNANDVLREKRGNCLGMSSLFIGLARELGLRAYYLDASDRVRSVEEDDAFIVSSGHVSAVVRTVEGDRIVDFDRSVGSYRRLRVMDDLQAFAHYYNNYGYDLLRGYATPDEIPADVWAAAQETFEAAIELNPSLARAWNNRGIAHGRLGRVDEAVLDYRVAISQDPDFAEPYNNLGVLYLRLDRPAEALEPLRKAVELAPRNPHHLYHLGLALEESGQNGAAAAEYQRALEVSPEHAPARVALEALAGEGDPQSPAP